jgi:hypothetical protein
MNNLRVDLKLLVAINSSISNNFSSLDRFTINLRYSTCFSSRRTWPKLFIAVLFFPMQLVQSCSLIHLLRIFARKFHLGRAMDFYQSTGKGTWTGIPVRSKPQRDWNSFMPTETIPRSIEGSILSLTEETILRHETTETKKFIQKGKMTKAFASGQ